MTRMGQLSHAAARAGQSTLPLRMPSPRRRADVDFAAARDSAANTPGREPRVVEEHVEQKATWWLSDRTAVQHPFCRTALLRGEGPGRIVGQAFLPASRRGRDLIGPAARGRQESL